MDCSPPFFVCERGKYIMRHLLNAIKDIFDPRDHTVAPNAPTAIVKVSFRSRVPYIKDQGQAGSCHDDRTEVMTDSGWKMWKDLTGFERLATVNPSTSELSYEKPS